MILERPRFVVCIAIQFVLFLVVVPWGESGGFSDFIFHSVFFYNDIACIQDLKQSSYK